MQVFTPWRWARQNSPKTLSLTTQLMRGNCLSHGIRLRSSSLVQPFQSSSLCFLLPSFSHKDKGIHKKFHFPLVLFVLLQCPLPTLSTNSEGNALNALKIRLIDPNNVLQSWDSTLVNPCTWFHVTCDSNNHVTRIYSIWSSIRMT